MLLYILDSFTLFGARPYYNNRLFPSMQVLYLIFAGPGVQRRSWLIPTSFAIPPLSSL